METQDLRELSTLHRKVPFYYEGKVGEDTIIHYGDGGRKTARINSAGWKAMLRQFSGQEVRLGRSPRNPSPGSLGEWLKKTLRRSGIASYVAPILIAEGYAEEVPGEKSSRIRFLGNGKH